MGKRMDEMMDEKTLRGLIVSLGGLISDLRGLVLG